VLYLALNKLNLDLFDVEDDKKPEKPEKSKKFKFSVLKSKKPFSMPRFVFLL
jgi:hypothetical protein